MPRLFRSRPGRASVLSASTIRAFDGGWNLLDNDLNLSQKYQRVLRNAVRSPDGSLSVRYGTRLFADVDDCVSGEIVNTVYHRGYIYAVMSSGEVATIDGNGNSEVVWSNAIANGRAGNPSGWGTTEFASFATFRNELIICNGSDKPLVVRRGTNRVEYLADLATGANAFTPICRYVVTHGEYVVMGGDVYNPSTIYVSNRNTSGTFVGDPAPNDSVAVDLGAWVPRGDANIKGMVSFRSNLIVFFPGSILIVTLGTYSGSTHVPDVTDSLSGVGAVSHRACVSIGDDVLFADGGGIASLKRALFTGGIQVQRVSELVDTAIQAELGPLSEASLEDNTFALYNAHEGQYMLFVPNGADPTETKAFVYTKIDTLKVNSMALFRQWNWACGCISELGNVFYAKGTQVYSYGSPEDPIYADAVGDQETFSDGFAFTDDFGFSPISTQFASGITLTVNDSGVPFSWEIELPWTDLGDRTLSKTLRYLAMDVSGTAPFTASMFVDNFYYDRSYLGEPFTDDYLFSDDTGFVDEDGAKDPALSMDFVGGDIPGFGADRFGHVFGGGRSSKEERLFAWVLKGKIFKMRFSGTSTERWSLVSYSLMYNKHSVRR